MKSIGLAAILILAAAVSADAQTSGERIYAERCAGCHDLTTQRIPPKSALQKMPAQRILRVLDFGVMMNVAYPLRRDEREAVARYLGTNAADNVPPASAFCADRTVRLTDGRGPQWNGWSPTSTNTRFQPAPAAGLTVDQVRRLELKWAFAFDGDVSTFDQPTIIGAYAFVGSPSGAVYALDTLTGCIHWTFQANGPVRSSILDVSRGGRHTLVFSDLVDGHMARLSGRTNKFGAFLDSTLDRIGDGAIFAGIALYFAGPGDSDLYTVLALVCLVMGAVTSYARARAEGLGFQAKVGIAERADRLVAILVMTFFSDVLDLPILLTITLWALAIASTITVGQRMLIVRRQALSKAPPA